MRPEDLERMIKDVATAFGYTLMFVAAISLLVFVLAFKDAHAEEGESALNGLRQAAAMDFQDAHMRCEEDMINGVLAGEPKDASVDYYMCMANIYAAKSSVAGNREEAPKPGEFML